LIDSTGHLKLTDFGLSKSGYKVEVRTWVKSYLKMSEALFSGPESSHEGLDVATQEPSRPAHEQKKIIGTPNYLAPEVITAEDHDFAVDWWAVGVIAFEMLTGSMPYAGNSPEEIFEHILKDEKDMEPSVGTGEEDISPAAWGLIQGLLQRDRTQRLGAHGADEVKNHTFFQGLDWTTLREQEPPFTPEIANMQDTSYASKKNFDLTEDAIMKELNGLTRSESQKDVTIIVH
jgi:microtubule-associated serine/threonine kinase